MILLREAGINRNQGNPPGVHFPRATAAAMPAEPAVAPQGAARMAASAMGWERRVRERGRASPHCVSPLQSCPRPVLHEVPSNILLQDRSLLSPVHGHFPPAATLCLTSGTGRRRNSGKLLGCVWRQLYKPAPARPAYQNMPSSLLRLMSLFSWQTEHTRQHMVAQKSEQMDPC